MQIGHGNPRAVLSLDQGFMILLFTSLRQQCVEYVVVAVVELVCVTSWTQDAVTYLLGHHSDVNSSASATVCYVSITTYITTYI